MTYVLLMNVAELRFRNNLTQADLAAAIGVRQTAVSTWERGQCVPRPSVRKRLDDFFGVKIEWPLPEARP